MDWSVDSEMLALVVAQTAAAGSGGPTADRSQGQQWVQVWRRSNWHWYLKHEARHDPAEVRVARFWSASVRGANRCKSPRPEYGTKGAAVCRTRVHQSLQTLAHVLLQGHLLIAWDDAAPSRLHTCAAAGRLSASNFLQQYAVRCSYPQEMPGCK